MWLNEDEISYQAYKYCLRIKDDTEVRKFITTPRSAYLYCMYIREDPKIKKIMTESFKVYCNYKLSKS